MGVRISLRDVWVRIGPVEVLRGVSLDAGGENIVLVGRNGAGKTTTLRVMLGLLKPYRGSIVAESNGVKLDAGRIQPHVVARLGVGYVPQGRMIFPDLTALENLEVSYGSSLPGDVLEWLYSLIPDLKRFIDRKGRYLSGGEQQMLAVARALVKRPKLLILDEPLEGLAPRIVKTIVEVLKSIEEEGVSIFITESGSLARVRGLVDIAYGIDRGEIVYKGPVEGIERDEKARARIWGF